MSGIEFGKTKEGNTVTKYLLKNKMVWKLL